MAKRRKKKRVWVVMVTDQDDRVVGEYVVYASDRFEAELEAAHEYALDEGFDFEVEKVPEE